MPARGSHRAEQRHAPWLDHAGFVIVNDIEQIDHLALPLLQAAENLGDCRDGLWRHLFDRNLVLRLQ